MSDNLKKNLLVIGLISNLALLVLSDNLALRVLNFLAIVLVIYVFSLVDKK